MSKDFELQTIRLLRVWLRATPRLRGGKAWRGVWVYVDDGAIHIAATTGPVLFDVSLRGDEEENKPPALLPLSMLEDFLDSWAHAAKNGGIELTSGALHVRRSYADPYPDEFPLVPDERGVSMLAAAARLRAEQSATGAQQTSKVPVSINETELSDGKIARWVPVFDRAIDAVFLPFVAPAALTRKTTTASTSYGQVEAESVPLTHPDFYKSTRFSPVLTTHYTEHGVDAWSLVMPMKL